MGLVEDPHLVVGQLDLAQVRVAGADRGAQGSVEGVDRAVALGDLDVALAVDDDLDHCLGLDRTTLALLSGDTEALQLEERLVDARLAPQQQLEGGLRRLVVVAAVLALLELLHHSRRGLVAELQSGALGLAADRRLARELRGEDVALVAHLGRVEVLEGAGVGGHSRRVHPGLVGEGVAADVGPVGVRRHVAELVEVVGGRRQARQLLLADHLEAHLQLQRRQDRDEVGVAAALAVAVDAALHQAGAGTDRGKRVGDRALGVIVGVDADLDRAVEAGDDGGRGLGDELRQAAAVGIAEGDVLRSRVGGGTDAFERIGGVVAVAVEEVLGVEDRALALFLAEGDRVGDHRQVLLVGDPGHLFQVQAPALADQTDDRGEGTDQDGKGPVVGGLAVAAPGHAEGGDRRLLQLLLGKQLEQLRLLRVGAGETGLDEVDAERVEGVDDLELLADRERHALAAHAVPQGGVVELYLFHLMPFTSRDRGEGLSAQARGIATPAARRLR